MQIDVNAPWNKSQPYTTSKPVYRKMVAQPSGKLAVGIGFDPTRNENMKSRVITYMPSLGILKDVTFHGMPKDSVPLAHYEIHLHPDVEDADAQRIGDDYVNHIAQGLRPEDFKHPELGSLDFDRHADINLNSESYKGAIAKDGYYSGHKFIAQNTVLGKSEINAAKHGGWMNVGAGGHLWSKTIVDSSKDKLPVGIGWNPARTLLDRTIRVIPESRNGPVIRDITHIPGHPYDDVGGFYDIHVQHGLALTEYTKIADKYIQHLAAGNAPEDFKDPSLDYHPKHHISNDANSFVFKGSVTNRGFIPSTGEDLDKAEEDWNEDGFRYFDHPTYKPKLSTMGASHSLSLASSYAANGKKTYIVRHLYPESMFIDAPDEYAPVIGQANSIEEAKQLGENYIKNLNPKIKLGIGFDPERYAKAEFPDDKEIEMGLEEEMEEHNIAKELAMKLVVDHLLKDPKYYTHQKEAKEAGLVKAEKTVAIPVGIASVGIGYNSNAVKTIHANENQLREAYKAAIWDTHRRNPITVDSFGGVNLKDRQNEVEKLMGHYLQNPQKGLESQPKHSSDGYTRTWDYTHLLPEEYRKRGYTLGVHNRYDPSRNITTWSANAQIPGAKIDNWGSLQGQELYGSFDSSGFVNYGTLPKEIIPHLHNALREAYTHGRISSEAFRQTVNKMNPDLVKSEPGIWTLNNKYGVNILEADKEIGGILHRLSVFKYDVPKTDPAFGKWTFMHQQGRDNTFTGENTYYHNQYCNSVEEAQALAEDRMRDFGLLPPRPKIPLGIGFSPERAASKPKELMVETPESQAFENAFSKDELSMPQPKTTPKKFNDQHPIGTQIDPPDAVSSQTVGRIKTQGVDPSSKAPLPPKNSMVTSGKVMGPTGRAVSSREPNQKSELMKGWPKSPEENEENFQNDQVLHDALEAKGATVTHPGEHTGRKLDYFDPNATNSVMTRADYESDQAVGGPQVKVASLGYTYGPGTQHLPSRGEWWTNGSGHQHRDFIGPNDEQHHIAIIPLKNGKTYITHQNMARSDRTISGILTDKSEVARDIVDNYIMHVNNPSVPFNHPDIIRFPPEAYDKKGEFFDYAERPHKYIEPPIQIPLGIGFRG